MVVAPPDTPESYLNLKKGRYNTMDNITFYVKHTKITKQQIIRETAKQLDDFTIAEIQRVYDCIAVVVNNHLAKANDDNIVSCNLGSGLKLTAKIKQVCGYPRIWYHARFTRYHNRQLNEL